MIYQEFHEKLKDFVVFTLADVRKIDPTFYLHQLSGWQKKGYIRKLRRGHYQFSDAPLSEDALYLTANRLYFPSYVSCEAALAYHGLIPEGVYSITSVSTRKTSAFVTPVGEFTYRQVKPALFFGYQIGRSGGQGFKIAEIEKAVVDYLYLNPNATNADVFHEWRFNAREFLARANLQKLTQYARQCGGSRLPSAVGRFLELISLER